MTVTFLSFALQHNPTCAWGEILEFLLKWNNIARQLKGLTEERAIATMGTAMSHSCEKASLWVTLEQGAEENRPGGVWYVKASRKWNFPRAVAARVLVKGKPTCKLNNCWIAHLKTMLLNTQSKMESNMGKVEKIRINMTIKTETKWFNP